jgi:hypothetical protein
MTGEFNPRNETEAETPKGKKKKWDDKDIEILRLVVLLASANPSEERLEWVFNEVREIAKMTKETRPKTKS